MHFKTFEALVERLDYFEKKGWEACPKWMKELDDPDEAALAAIISGILEDFDLSEIEKGT
jgi:hypothetical protein